METLVALAHLVDSRARRMEREARELRRLAAQLRDTVVNPDTATQEDTEDHAEDHV